MRKLVSMVVVAAISVTILAGCSSEKADVTVGTPVAGAGATPMKKGAGGGMGAPTKGLD